MVIFVMVRFVMIILIFVTERFLLGEVCDVDVFK